MSTILIIILILILVGAFPSWPYSRGWGYGPSGGIGLILRHPFDSRVAGKDLTRGAGFAARSDRFWLTPPAHQPDEPWTG